MNQMYYIDCLSGSSLDLFVKTCMQTEESRQLQDLLTEPAGVQLQTAEGNTLFQGIRNELNEIGYQMSVEEIQLLKAAVFSWEYLQMNRVVISEIAVSSGSGQIRGTKTILPLQETLSILAGSDLGILITDSSGPLLSPLSAAFYKRIRTQEKLPQNVKVLAAGQVSDLESGEILRIIRYEESNSGIREMMAASGDEIIKLESNIDDCSGESLGFVMEHLLSEGALDVFFTSIQMKKNRPAILLTVLCKEADQQKLEQVLFIDTTTIGIRRTRMERTILKRTLEEADTRFGRIRIKVCRIGEQIRRYPEYESIATICREQKLGYQEVYTGILTDLGKL